MEHVQYTMTEELVDEVAERTIPDFVPKKWDAKLWTTFFSLSVVALAAGLLHYVALEQDEDAEIVLLTLAGLILTAAVPALMLISLVMGRVVSYWVVFCRHVLRGRLKRAYRELMDTTVRWSFHEKGFETESVLTRRSVAWDDLKAIRLVPGQRYFQMKDGPELMFPETALTDRIRDLITRKSHEHSLPVRDERRS